VVREVWSLSGGPLCLDSSLVSQPSLVDTTIVLMQSLPNINPILRSDASLDHVVSYLVQPMVMLMKYLANITLVLWSDASLDHVLSNTIQLAVVLMQCSADTTPFLGSDASLYHVISNPIQTMVEEVVMLMQYSIDPTLLLQSEKSK
jgi:hypothetical protein